VSDISPHISEREIKRERERVSAKMCESEEESVCVWRREWGRERVNKKERVRGWMSDREYKLNICQEEEMSQTRWSESLRGGEFERGWVWEGVSLRGGECERECECIRERRRIRESIAQYIVSHVEVVCTMLTRIIECEPSAYAWERYVDKVSIVLAVPLHAPPYGGQHLYARCEQLNSPHS
jgi:hypothetical protein